MMTFVCSVVFGLFPEIDIDRYLPPPPPPIECASDMLDYPMRLLPLDKTQSVFFYVDGGELSNLDIPPGYLVSECELVRLTNLQVEAKRLHLELTAMRTLRAKEFALWRVLEDQYASHISRLLKPNWFERHRLAIGVVVGVLSTSLVVWTSAELVQSR